MFKGIGTNNELWSGVTDPVLRRPGCRHRRDVLPRRAPPHVAYQTGGVLAGVWYDNSAASPAAATGHQLGAEAVKAAAHFGNTTAASNRYAYYVILSPHGHQPGQLPAARFCAWHDYNGDPP